MYDEYDYSSSDEDIVECANSSIQEVDLSTKLTIKEQCPFEILTVDFIVHDVFDIVEQVHSFLELPWTTCRALLNHYKWDSQRLIGEYFEANDKDRYFEDAHVERPNANISLNNDESKECKICYTELETNDEFNLLCGHKYCKSCWNNYLTIKIVDEGLNHTIFCPTQNCKSFVDDDDIKKLVTDAEVMSKFHRSMTNNFVQHNNSMRWCPSPAGCDFAAKKIRNDKFICACKCGHEFCFECTEYWHEPVNCSLLKQWKSGADSETFKWIAQHAKLCPNCEAIIEKNGGCNHMTCRQCKHEFCWICMGIWSANHTCNRFDETQAINLDQAARFEHFRERYVNQLDSLNKEMVMYRNDIKVNEIKEQFDMTNNEVRFLRDAIKILIVSRRTLTYTFVFAYFLKKNNQVEIFEDNQSDLVNAVERLSGYLEEEMNADTIVHLKHNIINSYIYCESRCKALMDHIHEAEKDNLWKID